MGWQVDILLWCNAEATEAYIVRQADKYHDLRLKGKANAESTLEWWAAHADEYPLVGAIARHTLCIPASSATSERSFSKTGHIHRQRRRKLSDDHIASLSFLTWNQDLMKPQQVRPLAKWNFEH